MEPQKDKKEAETNIEQLIAESFTHKEIHMGTMGFLDEMCEHEHAMPIPELGISFVPEDKKEKKAEPTLAKVEEDPSDKIVDESMYRFDVCQQLFYNLVQGLATTEYKESVTKILGPEQVKEIEKQVQALSEDQKRAALEYVNKFK